MEIPNSLGMYREHGVEFIRKTDDQYIGNCVFCGDTKQHFYVNEKNRLWDCKRCAKSGNVATFLAAIVALHREGTTDAMYRELAEDRGIPAVVFKNRGIARDDRGRWLIPVQTLGGHALADIRIYDPKGQVRIRSTAGCKLSLFNAGALKGAETVYICEGEHDAMALDYLRRKAGVKGAVVGVPGAGVFKDKWAQFFNGKIVNILFDYDLPGENGSYRTGQALKGDAKKLKYIHWPLEMGMGYDVRDYVKEIKGGYKKAWALLMSMLKPYHVRDEPVEEKESKYKELKITSFEKLAGEFKKWLEMDESMVNALKISMAVVLANQLSGDPLWMFLVGPPGCGKTALLSAFKDAPCCVFQSTVSAQALVSGFRMAEDPSLIPKLNGKVFVIKDYTEILARSQPEQEALYGVLRGAYDGHVQRTFGNGVTREYDSRFSILAAVTPVIDGNTQATLGERFLKYRLVHDDHKDDRQIHAAIESIGDELEKEKDLQKFAHAFVNRDVKVNAQAMIPDWVKLRVTALAQLIAVLRAEVEREYYSDMIVRRPMPESGTRLAKQLIRLGIGLALVEGKKEIDGEVYAMLETVAMDTAKEFHLEIIKYTMEQGGETTRQYLSDKMRVPLTNLSRQLDDLAMLKAIKRIRSERSGRGACTLYQVTKRIRELWMKVRGE